jgi:hypothetical protein
MINAYIDINDKRLTSGEKRLLRQIALRISGGVTINREEIERVFGDRVPDEHSVTEQPDG